MRKLPRARLPRGAVIYEGPSRLTGIMIAVILTGLLEATRNRKTGDVIQGWVIPISLSPLQWNSERRFQASPHCGDCPQQWSWKGGCYVNISHAPTAIWKAYWAGVYEDWTVRMPDDVLTGRMLRLMAWGDPVAAPDFVLRRLLTKQLAGWVGYTHQFDVEDAQWLRNYLMASVDNSYQHELAERMGWRVFRPTESDVPPEGSIVCPNYTHGVQCADCLLCSGHSGRGLTSITVPVHGSMAANFCGGE